MPYFKCKKPKYFIDEVPTYINVFCNVIQHQVGFETVKNY